ncbi:nucleolar GTP-binding protein 1 isoform X2 [Cucurbita maxima]|uniref:Nucleolar GTP-binding protein 1 isoform X2 n=1 Tax=Cucurbita maxima TaxID=3661 RepID=A0A6J1IYU5_CUCMA|nr:nucleolar GTP-binding protein 1 isoform X2 [Cucurbita maxima]
MNGTCSTVFQLWQSPPTKRLIIRSFNVSYAGMHVIKSSRIYPTQCFHRSIQTETYNVVNGSYIPKTETKDENEVKEKDKPSKNLESVGAFQKLPMVMPSIDIFQSALKKAKRVSPTKGIANIAKRERNRGAKQLDTLMKELAVPLRTYLEEFPKKEYLHPYECSLIELTLGDGKYEEVLRKVDNLRKKVVSVGKEHASLCAKSTSKRDAEESLSVGMKKVEEVYIHQAKAVDDLLQIAKTLRAMPVVDLDKPTLCLVGAPNVGKSSLVRILSTGKPEICNYPFTTRGILMGHIVLNYQHFQVTDTPGLLKRSDDDRNNLEKLTLAVLSHLPTAVLFVHDLSGECGTSPSDQLAIYKEMKERYGNHLWLNVVSKCDLLKESPVIFSTESYDHDDIELERYRRFGPDGALLVSVKNDVGLIELKERVHEMLVSQMTRIKTKGNHGNTTLIDTSNLIASENQHSDGETRLANLEA